MFNINYPPAFQICVQGRIYMAYPFYCIRLKREIQHTEDQELKNQEKEQQKWLEFEQEEQNNPSIDHNSYVFPGKTKNYYKTLGNKLSLFIQNNFNDIQIGKDQNIQKFLKLKKEKFNKTCLKQLIKSKLGKQIVKIYFGNFLWCSSILKQSKSFLNVYLNLNKKIFKRKLKSKK